jgi:hypothetical protein
MLSSKKIFSAMAGLAMLAVPVTALAGHRDDRQQQRPFAAHDQGFQRQSFQRPFAPREQGFQRPNAWHDQGLHNGWAKHQFAPAAPVQYGRPYFAAPRVAPIWLDHHEDRNEYRPARNYWAPPLRPIGWHGEGENDDWGRRNYRCNGDGDDCRWNNNGGSRYWQNNGGYNYGAPYSWYEEQPPAAYGPSQQLGWLTMRRQRALGIMARMRARGDYRGAARMAIIVNALDRRIGGRGGYQGYNTYDSYPPAAYAPAVSNYGYGSPLAPILGGAAAPYYGNPNPYYASNPYSGANGYYGNNTTTALVSMLPLLLGPH